MGRQRFAPEFKDEAVRQMTERGHPVTKVAARLGVSSHSLYKWVQDVRPSKEEERSGELLESKKKVLKLRSELRRVEEERDILKKPRRTLQGNPSKVRLHPCGTCSLLDQCYVQNPWSRPQRLLRLGPAFSVRSIN